MHTPGHLSDHLCFVTKEPCGLISLFTGDHIIGANSTYFDDYPSYFESLIKTQVVVKNQNISKIYVGHSLSMLQNQIAFSAKDKVKDYLSRRIKRDN